MGHPAQGGQQGITDDGADHRRLHGRLRVRQRGDVADVGLAASEFGTLWTVVSRPDLDTLRAFLGTPTGAAAIWAHLIAFDLFIGSWIHRDARERGVPHLIVAPLLVLTILLSPLGLLSYLLIRVFKPAPSGPRLHDRELQQRHAAP